MAYNERLERLKKSLAASGIPYQDAIDKVIQQVVEYKNPVFNNIPRKKGAGDGWHVYQRTAATTSALFVNDTQSLSESTGTYAKVDFTYKTIGVQGKVSRLAQAVGQSLSDALANEIEAKANEFKDMYDKAMIRGDHTVGANQFDGIDKLIAGQSGQSVMCYSTAYDAHALTTASMDKLIDTCAYNPDLIITSKAGRRALNALMQTNQRFVDTVEIKGGAKTISYNNIPILVSTNIPDTIKAIGSTGTISSWTSGTTTAIYCLDTTYFWMGVLSDVTYKMLDKVSSQYDLFDIYCDSAPVLANPLSCARMLGVIPS